MATSNKAVVVVNGTVSTAGTDVTPTPPYDNTEYVTIYNSHATGVLYWNFGSSVGSGDGGSIQPGKGHTLHVGVRGKRAGGDSLSTLRLDADTSGTTFEITYTNRADSTASF